MEIDQQSVVTMTQPWEPNLQMQASTLTNLQSKYDEGHQKLSNLYGSLLNSAMTRTDNIQAREEFFKLINTDIKKMANVDFSLDSNKTAAASVFQSIYNNKNIVKDMAWTRNIQEQFARADAFRNCVDATKCGGRYWEEGEKYLQYKRQEFATASQDEAMGFTDPKFIPYNNMMEKAIEQANKAGLSIKTDVVSGGYKVTTKNGEALATPLSSLFTQLFESNPQFHDMYKVQAYNNRKDWMSEQVSMGKYKDEGEAMVGYVKERADVLNRQIANLTTDIDNDADRLTERYTELYEKAQKGEISEGDPEYQRLVELDQQAQQIGQAKQYSDMLKATQKNMFNTQNIRAIGDMLDDQHAALLFKGDVSAAAGTLAYKDYEKTLEEDKFALEEQKFKHDVSLEQTKHANSKELVEWKAKFGAYGSKTAPDLAQKISDFSQANQTAKDFDVRAKFLNGLGSDVAASQKEAIIAGIEKAGSVKAWLDTEKNNPNVKTWTQNYEKLIGEYKNNWRTANEKAKDYILKGGEEPVTFNFSVMGTAEKTEFLKNSKIAEIYLDQIK